MVGDAGRAGSRSRNHRPADAGTPPRSASRHPRRKVEMPDPELGRSALRTPPASGSSGDPRASPVAGGRFHRPDRCGLPGASGAGAPRLPRRLVMSAHRRMSRVLGRTVPEFSRCTGTVMALLPQRGRASPTLTLTDYKAPNYWLGYRFGFVRRGLPGALLARVVGGPPTYRQVEVAAATLSRAAALSVVPIAIQAGRHVPPGIARTLATGLSVS